MQHHIALPPDAMGKITYIAPPGQYSLKVCLLNLFTIISPALFILADHSHVYYFFSISILFKMQFVIFLCFIFLWWRQDCRSYIFVYISSILMHSGASLYFSLYMILVFLYICRILCWSLSFKVSKRSSPCFRFLTFLFVCFSFWSLGFPYLYPRLKLPCMYFTHLQTWPVRTPRPVASKLAADTPLLTGQVNLIVFYCLIQDLILLVLMPDNLFFV